jgi:hypothetical protein
MTKTEQDILLGFRSRFAMQPAADGGGVIVDLQRGSYFQLNRTAVEVCRVLELTGTLREAIERLSNEMAVPSGEASHLIGLVRESLLGPGVRDPPPGPFRYVHRGDDQYALEEDGVQMFTIDRRRRTMRLCADPIGGVVPFYVRALVPKLLALLEVPVLHAAACHLPTGFTAFCGKSGAGKTTTAQAFEAAGSLLVSEDLLILRPEDGPQAAFINGERLARTWAAEAATRLEEVPDKEISYEGLSVAASGPSSGLAAIWFVDSARRSGNQLKLRLLAPTEALSALLGNGFLAAVDAKAWRHFLRRSSEMVEQVRLTEATMPDGRDALTLAAHFYTENSAS